MDNSITHDKELVAVDVAAMENLVWPHKTTLMNIEVQGSKAFIQLQHWNIAKKDTRSNSQ